MVSNNSVEIMKNIEFLIQEILNIKNSKDKKGIDIMLYKMNKTLEEMKYDLGRSSWYKRGLIKKDKNKVSISYGEYVVKF